MAIYKNDSSYLLGVSSRVGLNITVNKALFFGEAE